MEATALADAGVRVSVISPCPTKPDPDRPDEPAEPVRVIDGVHVYRYPPPKEAAGLFGYFSEYWHSYTHTKSLLARVWRECPFDAIQGCNPPDFFWALAEPYKKRFGVKYVFDHHDLCPELYVAKFGRKDLLYHVTRWFERKTFRAADACIATNESYKRIATGRGGKRDADVTVVRSGPRLSMFEPVTPDESLKRGREFLGVYLGVMGRQDGVDYALRAIRHAVDAGLTSCSFTFIGKGEAFDELVRLATELKLDDYVRFTGRVSDEELIRHLSTADIAIAPDPEDDFNTHCTMNKIVEYMAMSLPIVSFALNESRFSAADAAVYVADNDEAEMGRQIKSLLENPDRRAEMGRVGRDRFEQGLSWDASEVVYLDFWRRLLGPLPCDVTDVVAEEAFGEPVEV
ncbi:MAG: glycosyltransferase family 4 protein [Planctomycetota bacterium]